MYDWKMERDEARDRGKSLVDCIGFIPRVLNGDWGHDKNEKSRKKFNGFAVKQ